MPPPAAVALFVPIGSRPIPVPRAPRPAIRNEPNKIPSHRFRTNETGRGTNDQPHAFKLLGSYQAPWNITVGANFQALSGLPRDRNLSVTTPSSTNYQVENRGTYRQDFLNLLSLRGDKRFRFNGQHAISVVGEVHNALNSHAGHNSFGTATQSFASQAAFDAARLSTSYFGRVQEIVAPRILKISVRLEF